MTEKQLELAKDIKAKIRGYKEDLDKVLDFQKRIQQICNMGICISNGMNYDTRIFPREEEMSALLVTMRNRLENRIAELQKEFEEL